MKQSQLEHEAYRYIMAHGLGQHFLNYLSLARSMDLTQDQATELRENTCDPLYNPSHYDLKQYIDNDVCASTWQFPCEESEGVELVSVEYEYTGSEPSVIYCPFCGEVH
jgi:hypothetical protein